MRKKSQISMEFLMTVGFLSLVFISVLIITNFRTAQVNEFKDLMELKGPCDKVTSTISNTVALGDRGRIKGSIDFNMTVLGQTRQILVWEKQLGKNRTYYCFHPIFNITNAYTTGFEIPKDTEFTTYNNNGSIEIWAEVLIEGSVVWLRTSGSSFEDWSEADTEVTINGNVDCTVGNNTGNACFFPGDVNTDYVEVSNQNYDSNWTMSAWIWPESGTQGYIYASDTSTPGADKWGGLQVALPEIRYVYDGGSRIIGNINSDNWTHVLLTTNISHVNMYINATLTGSYQMSDVNNFNLNDNFLIGYTPSPGGAGTIFDGYIDDIRVYNRSMDQDEIDKLYNSYFNIIDLIGIENFVR